MISVGAPCKRSFRARPGNAVSWALSYPTITNLRSNAPYLAVACQNSEGSNSALKGRYEPNQWVQLRLLLTVLTHMENFTAVLTRENERGNWWRGNSLENVPKDEFRLEDCQTILRICSPSYV